MVLSVVCCLLSSVFCRAQDIIVIGQVFSADDQTPLSGATVWFSGTNIGTTTNEEGYFFLRSPKMENSVIASFVGYKKRETKLDKSRRDQMIEIYLKEEHNVLDEIFVSPNKAEIARILKLFNQNRNKNNPKNFSGFELENQSVTKLYLSNIRQKWLQKKVFSELKNGILTLEDSTLIMPIHQNITNKNEKYLSEKTEINPIFSDEKTVELFGKEQLNLILNAYIPQANFYDNSILMFGKKFVSPTSKQGNLYYNYFLDTVYIDSVKNYEIHFHPKNNKNLTFDGKMWLDAKTFALTKVIVSLPKNANINYVNSFSVEHNFAKIDTTKYFYNSVNQNVSFNYNFTFDKNQNYTSAILTQQSDYKNFRLCESEILLKTENDVTISDEQKTFGAAIDTINSAKIQKIAYALVDIFMNGYIHAGIVDFGNVANFLRYNALEGFRPTLSLRTSEKLNKNFTLGGYIGYGFGDKKGKYGGEFQARFGKKREHQIGLFYDNDVVRFGYGDALLLNENMSSGENILTSFSWGQGYKQVFQQQKIDLKYLFEKRGVRFTFNAKAAQVFSNQFIDFQQNNRQINDVKIIAATAGLRLSFKENSIDNFFHRFYLNSPYPVLNLQGEIGFCEVGEFRFVENGKITLPYAKIKITLKQSVVFPLGKFNYAVEGAKIFGNVPYILLESPTTIRGLWYNSYNFDLVNQGEFLADSYISAHLKYYSNGLIFNNIPYVKVLNLRETAFVNFAWGGVFNPHEKVLQMPLHKSLQMPYIEAGVGITNILRFLSVESVWRITHRDEMKWGIRCKVYLDF
ncbi:MAG: DUF5686 and carboxypeptidase regulatory-like domain-containing protein [Prevotellaceae bacterium]|nr:DUF5686 and carboxypeptidase regulatory-like domain-containing protein [Prevotellaceae bacterium]